MGSGGDKHMTDLASAKTYLKKLGALVLYLYKRELEEIPKGEG